MIELFDYQFEVDPEPLLESVPAKGVNGIRSRLVQVVPHAQWHGAVVVLSFSESADMMSRGCGSACGAWEASNPGKVRSIYAHVLSFGNG